MGWNPLNGPNEPRFAVRAGAGLRFFDMTEAYSKALRALAKEEAHEEGFALEEGVYLATPGPSFETPAEIRAFRALGATLVGMSTVPETIVARHMGIEVLGISCVTNLAAGLGATPLSHEEVNETGRMGGEPAGRIAEAAGAENRRRGWKRRSERGNESGGRSSTESARSQRRGLAVQERRACPFRPRCWGLPAAPARARPPGQRAGAHVARPALSSRRLLSRPLGYCRWPSAWKRTSTTPR